MSQPRRPYQPVKQAVDLPELERETLAFWDARAIFQRSLDQSRGQAHYSFYDGPPFATGLPHYGHLLAGVLKDIVPRYWTMRGYHVPRRFGWDCHGLPVEHEISQALGLQGAKQIREYGVDRYNAACRGIVQRYAEEWKATVRRIGRWVDMDRPYFTMDRSFMQSVWWVFQQLWNRGLIYEGHKVVPYSIGVSTVLSNFEANQNYQDVQDPAITVAFRERGSPETYLLAWTTTPWTLPSNLALAVSADLPYVTVIDRRPGAREARYILAEPLLERYFHAGEAEVVGRARGAELAGRAYEPILPYFADTPRAFTVLVSGHVTADSGTGIVHIAPAYGEDDHRLGLAAGLPVIDPVDEDGRFTAEVPDLTGTMVKAADAQIISRLKAEGKLFRHDTITHSYPFCWRSDTPLIYKAVPSWFVRVEQLRAQLHEANARTSWVPEHLRDGRFGDWLDNARDWAVSRNRFWGTPLPIWRNAEGEVVCVGSAAELAERAGVPVDDLHLDAIGGITIPSQRGGTALRQTGGVLDCWFESGSMPYAQWGYPQEGRAQLEVGFPADFIAEGLDQTRGWFYTLTVIGAALFGKSPFQHVVVNGLILAEDGKKMSKRLKNYPDPAALLESHGADAIRLYLIDSPAVKAEPLRFSEAGVREIVRKILLRWWNAYSFFVSYANIDGFVPRGDAARSENLLDQWVLSRLHTLIHHANAEMAAYRLYKVVPALEEMIEDLTNTYIRFAREHFWADGMPEDKRYAYETLYTVLATLAKVMAPFTPFLAEAMHRNLAAVAPGAQESVHLERYPDADEALRRPELEAAVARMTQLVVMGRNLRERLGIKAKIPLNRMWVIHRDAEVLTSLRALEPYFAAELGVREVIYTDRERDFIAITTKAHFPRLGPRLGKRMGQVAGAIAKLTDAEVATLEHGGALEVAGERITLDDVDVRRAPRSDADAQTLAAHALVSIRLDPEVTAAQIDEGRLRELLRLVQSARKDADLPFDARIDLQLHAPPALAALVAGQTERVLATTLARSLVITAEPAGDHVKRGEVDDEVVVVALTVVG